MIHVEQLSCTITGTEILSDVSFSIAKGEFVSIIGPNGAGKTTLLRALVGLLEFTGDVLYDGAPLKSFSPRSLAKLVGYVPQLNQTLPAFSVEEFVLMGRYAHRGRFCSTSLKDKEMAERSLALTNTEKLAERSLQALSSGEKQRVLLAAALCQEADILILDEPTAHLDPFQEAGVYELLHRLHIDEGLTLIVVSHDINRAAISSSRILGLKEGRVVFDGIPQGFMLERNLENIYGIHLNTFLSPITDVPIALPARWNDE